MGKKTPIQTPNKWVEFLRIIATAAERFRIRQDSSRTNLLFEFPIESRRKFNKVKLAEKSSLLLDNGTGNLLRLF